ncbi:hypothetical protein [Spirillospora sp. NBC_01491]|uniref:hypothetical protein n=1 Tax=Spirillospora sp. NBC_01491 TaxID=2976007 RepID=UPI002E32FDC7|nr:hypothetical protein [Spirillospora sp. NBC_01491]
MSVFAAPVLIIEQRSAALEYEIGDARENPLARGVQAAGERPRKGLLGRFGSGPANARVVVQVSGLDGAPLFFVDRAPDSPVAIVAPDGTLIGRFAEDTAAFARSHLEGRSRLPGGRSDFNQAQQLLDAGGTPLCSITWEPTYVGGVIDHAVGGRACAYTDPDGTELARMERARNQWSGDRYVLHLPFRLPDPLRTLVIASPIAFDLSRS